MGTFSKSLASCGGFVAGPHEVDRVPAHLLARLPVHRLRRAGRRRRRARRAARHPLGGRPAAARRACSTNARYLRDGLQERGFAVVAPQPLGGPAGGDVVTPIVPVLVGDDWKAALLWKALYDAGVFVNTALHPAVPPGGALLRTSVMATHDRATLDRALEVFAAVKARLRGRARTAPRARRARLGHRRRIAQRAVSRGGRRAVQKKGALSGSCARAAVDRSAPERVRSERADACAGEETGHARRALWEARRS